MSRAPSPRKPVPAGYEEVGALRHVLQNHLLQVVALLTMEPPVGTGPEDVRDEKVHVFRAIRPLDPAFVVRGQYRGYRDEEGVARDSAVETFITARIDDIGPIARPTRTCGSWRARPPSRACSCRAASCSSSRPRRISRCSSRVEPPSSGPGRSCYRVPAPRASRAADRAAASSAERFRDASAPATARSQ